MRGPAEESQAPSPWQDLPPPCAGAAQCRKELHHSQSIFASGLAAPTAFCTTRLHHPNECTI